MMDVQSTTSYGIEATPVPQLQGVPLDSLALVRVQGGLKGCSLNERGDLVLSRAGSGRADEMNSFHFALNGVVSNHVYGAFDHPFVLISSLADTCSLGNKPSGLGAADTWFHADKNAEMTIAKPMLLAPEGSKVPEALKAIVEFYPPGNSQEEMLANRSAAASAKLEEMGLVVRAVGMHGWKGEGMTDPGEFKDLARALGVPHLESGGHMNSADNHFAVAMSSLQASLASFDAGERIYTDDTGLELDLKDRCEDLLRKMNREADKQFAMVGDHKAYDFHMRRIEDFEGRVLKVGEQSAAERAPLASIEANPSHVPPPLQMHSPSPEGFGVAHKPPPLPPESTTTFPPPLPPPLPGSSDVPLQQLPFRAYMRSPTLGPTMFGGAPPLPQLSESAQIDVAITNPAAPAARSAMRMSPH